MKAIVLAAGVGSRLRPITTLRPKHLLEIAGTSILKRIIDPLLQNSTIDEVIVVINYHANQIEDALKAWYFDDKRITTIFQKETKGTGDAVDVVLHEKNINESFIVINGDVLFAEDLNNFIKSANGNGLIVGASVDNPTDFGILEYQDNKLSRVLEKPQDAPLDSLINAGFYIFPQSAVPLFHNLRISVRGEREMTDVLDQLVSKGENIQVYGTTDGWFDIGFPWKILDANEFFIEREQKSYSVLADLEPNVQIHGNVHIAKSARIRSGVYIEGPVFIDEGADIGPNCFIRGKTYLGKNTRVGNGCEIKNSVIYEETHAAHLSYVGDSVLGRSCNLGAGTITANLRHDGKPVKMTIKGNRVSTGRRKLGVIMGDQVKTGIGVDLLPGVKISSRTWLGAGEVVARDK